MQKYLSENIVDIFFILGISSIAILVISALSIGYFIKKIPYDYFLNDKRGISEYKYKNPIFWVIAVDVRSPFPISSSIQSSTILDIFGELKSTKFK